MPSNVFANLDARWLWDLADQAAAQRRAESRALLTNGVEARLRLIAERLERLDAKSLDGTFVAGRAFEAADATRRSNVLGRGRRVTNEDGEMLIAALQEPERVKRLPAGARTPKAKPVIDATKTTGAVARKGYRITDL